MKRIVERDAGGGWRRRAVEPRVGGIQAGLPAQPVASAFFSKKILLLESHLEREFLGAGADEHDVVGVVHDCFCDERWRRDVLERADCSSSFGRAVHAGRVQLHHALLVRQATQSHRLIVGIELLDIDSRDDRVEGVRILTRHHVVGACNAANAVSGRDNYWRTGEIARGRAAFTGGEYLGACLAIESDSCRCGCAYANECTPGNRHWNISGWNVGTPRQSTSNRRPETKIELLPAARLSPIANRCKRSDKSE